MEYSFYSPFLPGQGYFGKCPTQEEVLFLEQKHGITLFVDLTSLNECTEYKTFNSKKVRYIITDGKIPSDSKSFRECIYYLVNELKKGQRIYIHTLS